MQRRKFSRECKLEAVRLVRERGARLALASPMACVHLRRLRSTARLRMMASMAKNPVTVARSKLVMSF
jgi:transposase-like protein